MSTRLQLNKATMISILVEDFGWKREYAISTLMRKHTAAELDSMLDELITGSREEQMKETAWESMMLNNMFIEDAVVYQPQDIESKWETATVDQIVDWDSEDKIWNKEESGDWKKPIIAYHSTYAINLDKDADINNAVMASNEAVAAFSLMSSAPTIAVLDNAVEKIMGRLEDQRFNLMTCPVIMPEEKKDCYSYLGKVRWFVNRFYAKLTDTALTIRNKSRVDYANGSSGFGLEIADDNLINNKPVIFDQCITNSDDNLHFAADEYSVRTMHRDNMLDPVMTLEMEAELAKKVYVESFDRWLSRIIVEKRAERVATLREFIVNRVSTSDQGIRFIKKIYERTTASRKACFANEKSPAWHKLYLTNNDISYLKIVLASVVNK